MAASRASEPNYLTLESHERPRTSSLAGELWRFVRATGKWWLIPVLVALLVVGAVAILSASPYAPFLYSLF